MTPSINTCVLSADAFFHDGKLIGNHHLVIENGQTVALIPNGKPVPNHPHISAKGHIITPGFVDLQVNGGGGVLLNETPTPDGIATLINAHRARGTAWVFPTLITDSLATTQAAIQAAIAAQNIDGFAGLHLEGPHLSIPKKGAHDAAFIRPMTSQDRDIYLAAREKLPALMLTVAPENVTSEDVAILTKAGILVSLGHSNAPYENHMDLMQAGAHIVTHLHNAMRPITGRDAGLVGVALLSPDVFASIIPDGHHVSDETFRLSLQAKAGDNHLFAVSDAMKTVGTGTREFTLNGRKILRAGGRLTLENGTLAGADISLSDALTYMAGRLNLPLEDALSMLVDRPVLAARLPTPIGQLLNAKIQNITCISNRLDRALPLPQAFA
ncbi:MAG: N-acetylglucosamine-6-phosphate deacetylase [Halocynthiibacter sp.]